VLESLLMVCDDGEQIGALVVGFVASASTVYRTSPEAGAVYVTLPAEKVPTSGLLAGTIKE
jgi:hypothetical protein